MQPHGPVLDRNPDRFEDGNRSFLTPEPFLKKPANRRELRLLDPTAAYSLDQVASLLERRRDVVDGDHLSTLQQCRTNLAHRRSERTDRVDVAPRLDIAVVEQGMYRRRRGTHDVRATDRFLGSSADVEGDLRKLAPH